MRALDSVWAIDTGMPSSRPKVTNLCSSYRNRSSSYVNVAPSNTRLASTKSSPWSFRLRLRLTSSHVNRIGPVYSHDVYTSRRSNSCRLTCRITRPQRESGAEQVRVGVHAGVRVQAVVQPTVALLGAV